MPEFDRKILVLFAHPGLENSRCNQALKEAVCEMSGVTFHDLYAVYPDFAINVKAEQTLLTDHDAVIFQFPFYWYSTPAILKEWQDLVLEHGWAYGQEGNQLQGKLFGVVTTSGGGPEAYQRGGYNHYTMNELLHPLERTAILCGMRWLLPFAVQHALTIEDHELVEAAKHYRRYLEAIRDDTLDLNALPESGLINTFA
ncbi:NAD(P)H-dependent oxidoreductase [Rubellicoccus peritrichatus]|uniref:NAD(P)H-dependent oxidoreductase n=1 Tax=Rubellicoccus peritrichatus TaxID=3080537 RepID=A0AAQ3LA75_9BACT|nr:NAD(P)H-dependent oxidoreductase [Puniceicoccus sp. CR14]WOO40794.1 NAD(P)H-dependent oxidoreductase [Puniceicoccus sp. CR14]